MSGQLRELKNRIRSVENTKKITRAMEMVAAAKLRRFQILMLNARPFTEKLEEQVRRLHQAQNEAAERARKEGGEAAPLHPFFEKRKSAKAALVVITSDTGLAGSYNLDLINETSDFLAAWKGSKPLLIGIGKSGIAALKRQGHHFEKTYTDLRASRVEEILADFKTYLEELFVSGQTDSIHIVYSHFQTVTSYVSLAEKILPLEEPKQEPGEKAAASADYIFEPSPEAIFEKLIPLYFEAKTRMIFLEALVSEQIARMSAMHQATKNAKEMIEALVLQRNKARQANITKEIIEIVSGSKAARK